MNPKKSVKMPEHQHPAELIREEMDARDCALKDLCLRMAAFKVPAARGDIFDREYGICRLAMEMYLCLWPYEPNMLLGDLSDSLAGAFEVSPDFFRNLEANRRASQETKSNTPKQP